MDDAQVRADEAEAAADARYARLQRLMDLLEEPARRADAMLRLEAWLQLHPPPHHRAEPGASSA